MSPASAGLVARSRTATEIAAEVRAGRGSARAAVETALDRIAAVEPHLNAFTVVLAEQARTAADAIDALPPEDRGPLAGVPIAVKAEADVAGVVTTFGGRSNSTPAAADSEVVRRLRAAGAVIVGVTTMPEFGQFPFTESVAYGATRNPWLPERSTGGSSGGSAAAVASGCVPVAIGGDGGGSIRIPSSCCGLVGLKPARGRVSQAPHAALWGTLGTAGPLTGTVADAALVYDVINGVTPVDRWSAPPPQRSYVAAAADHRPRRIAWSTRPALGPVRVDPEVMAAVERTAAQLAAAGHEVVPVEGRWPDVQAAFVPQFFAAIRECAGLVEHPERLELRTRHTARLGVWARGPVLRKAVELGEAARRSFQDRFEGYDAVLSPIMACLPPTLGQLDGAGSVRALLRSLPMIAFTTLANTTGLPAISVPAGESAGGLPIGVQLSGLVDDEGPLLGIAGSLGK
ncbi:amidase family protein [Nocardioides sp. BP30]|uniref:amidase family protein n=1 Tax=Nocardioides sp. BP30 TaxID=3036374 RepID=UPI002468CE3A|nr:amidase family protein [Nocardioides sp. BP30]WGL51046.1 amidase family protein [Nocardioides sp. BP30]